MPGYSLSFEQIKNPQDVAREELNKKSSDFCEQVNKRLRHFAEIVAELESNNHARVRDLKRKLENLRPAALKLSEGNIYLKNIHAQKLVGSEEQELKAKIDGLEKQSRKVGEIKTQVEIEVD